jgi:hypothetical protein
MKRQFWVEEVCNGSVFRLVIARGVMGGARPVVGSTGRSTTIVAAVCLGACLGAQAARYDSGFAEDGLLPDNTTPCSDTRPVNECRPAVDPASLRLNLSGDANGALYAQLSYNGGKLILLNQAAGGMNRGATSVFGCSDVAFSNIALQAGVTAGDLRLDRGEEERAGASPGDGADLGLEDVSMPHPTGVSHTSQRTWFSQFGGLNSGYLAVVGAGVCVAGAGFGVRKFTRAVVEER